MNRAAYLIRQMLQNSETGQPADVPSAEFKTQVALVKAARNAIHDTTAQAQSALRRTNDEYAEVDAIRGLGDDLQPGVMKLARAYLLRISSRPADWFPFT